MNPRDLVQGFVESMTQLMAVMKHEFQLVRAREFAKLEDLQRRKLLLAKSYDEHQTRLRKNLSTARRASCRRRGSPRIGSGNSPRTMPATSTTCSSEGGPRRRVRVRRVQSVRLGPAAARAGVGSASS